MRDMQEYTAEVFRRSEERIQKRKQMQKRIVLGVVPVALCAVVFSATIWPGLQHKNAPSNSQPEAIIGNADGATGDSTDETNGSISRTLYVQVQIQSPSGCETITESQTIAQYASILSAFLSPPVSGAGGSIPSGDNTSTGDMGTSPQYTITFTTKLGNQLVYTLSESTLTQTNYSQATQLTDSQLKELKDALQLPG